MYKVESLGGMGERLCMGGNVRRWAIGGSDEEVRRISSNIKANGAKVANLSPGMQTNG